MNEIMRMIIADELPVNVATNLKKGISELELWTQNEWYCFFCFVLTSLEIKFLKIDFFLIYLFFL